MNGIVVAIAAGLALSGPGAASAQSLREVFRHVNPSVVLIEATGQTPTDAPAAGGVGSGVLISADGQVLTAAHVVSGADTIAVRFMDGAAIAARVVASAPFADVALLQLAHVPEGATVAEFDDSDTVQIGDQVFTIGAPYGATHSLAVGWISARRVPEAVYEDATALEVFQTDLAVYEGNSGGPLFGASGRVVGIVTHVLARPESAIGPSFSVTGNVARKLLIDQRRTWFGVETFMLDGDLAQALNVPESAGLLVQSVARGSLADRLGLRGGTLRASVGDSQVVLGGDIILDVHGVPVSSTAAFFAAFTATLDALRPDEMVAVQIWRGGKRVTLRARAVAP